MPSPSIPTADKIIVDRTLPHRNSDVARAVRAMRDRLVQQPGTVAYDRELLVLHAHATVSGATAIPLLILLIAIGGLLAGMSGTITIWAMITVLCYSALALIAKRVDRTAPEDIDVVATRRLFLIAHAVSGLGWTYLAMSGCHPCEIGHFPVVKAAVLVTAIAATALMTASLRGALIATFFLPVLAFAVTGETFASPSDALITGLLVLSLPFFGHVSATMNQAALATLSFRSEKDALIAELETAKAMSDEARRRAEEANLAKSRFLASMSHELRTPLNAILGFSEVMENEVLGPIENATYREYAHDIHTSGQHLLELINEILDLSRIEAGRYQLNEEAVSLASIAEDCCHMMTLKARGKGIRIIDAYEADLPKLYADGRSIRQIMLNLLSNAVKFSSMNGEVNVRVGWTVGGGQYVSVRDNGPGIPADEIPIVLAAFGQGSIAIKNAEQGAGLGLPIVQGLVAMHGGTFTLNSKLREGTEALVTFPQSRVLAPMPAVPRQKRAR